MIYDMVKNGETSPETIVNVQYNLSHIVETTSQSVVNDCMKKAEWSWNDVMVGFREIGYDPSENEKQRILKNLFEKKLKAALIRQSKSLDERYN